MSIINDIVEKIKDNAKNGHLSTTLHRKEYPQQHMNKIIQTLEENGYYVFQDEYCCFRTGTCLEISLSHNIAIYGYDKKINKCDMSER